LSYSSEIPTVTRFGIHGGDEPVVSVVIPVRNEGERLGAAIRSIVDNRSSRFPLQVVVVDDCSSDGCCASLREMYFRLDDNVEVLVIRLPRWSGVPYARNVGGLASRASTLFITDANILFPPHWDVPVRNRIAPNRALCATIADQNSSFRAYGGMLHLPSMGFNWLGDPTVFGGYAPLAPCAGTILPRELFRRLGGYDTAMPVYGAAEPEFSVRLWLSGAEIAHAPELVLKHWFRPSTERRPFLDTIRLVQVHNYLRFGLLYLDCHNSTRVVEHYAATAPEVTRQALQRVLAGDVWHRRNVLLRTLPLRFEAFLERFGFLDASGRFRYR
jgi:glycosyltransferase involved in cell wall biosynthesis